MLCRWPRFAFLILFPLQFVHAEDWPHWRGPQRNGVIAVEAESSEKTTFTELWRADVATGFSSVVVSHDLLFTMGNRENKDVVWALNAKSGEIAWQYEYDCPLDPNLFEGGPTSTPTIADGNVYTISRRGDLFCLDMKSGAVIWESNLQDDHELNVPTWGFAGSPLVLGEKLILNAGSAGICFNAKSGKLLWKSDNDVDAGYSTPLPIQVGDETLVLLLSAKALDAVALDDGELRWSIRWITRYGINAADPVIVDDEHLLVSSGYSKGVALVKFDATSAEQLWRSRDLSNQMSPGIYRDGALYSVSGDAGDQPTFVCLDTESGEALWTDERFGSGTLLGIGEKIFVLSEEGTVSIIHPSKEELKVLTSHKVVDGKCWTPMAFADSCLFIRNADGVLVCTKVVSPSQNGE